MQIVVVDNFFLQHPDYIHNMTYKNIDNSCILGLAHVKYSMINLDCKSGKKIVKQCGV